MINFCTLFDSNYSAKGLAMYYSLLEHCTSFHLYIIAFDDKLVDVLTKMNLEHVTIVTLHEFEDEELLRIKPTRSAGEYCWTCSSSTILYCISRFHLESCTYIDADLFFYSNPQILIDEMGDKDVLIISHRYTSRYDQTLTSGKYCVQFMTFKNTPRGIGVLQWWRDACLEWCYARVEDGKFGDQKYLDDWPTRFDGIHELQHLGGGVAPWNDQQYSFCKIGDSIKGTELSTGKTFDLVFFHFHQLVSTQKGFLSQFYVGEYELPVSVKKEVYSPYIKCLINCHRQIKRIDRSIDGLATKPSEFNSFYKWGKTILGRYLHKDNKYFYWIR